VIELHLPPLRERLEDIVELSSNILKKLTGNDISMSPMAIDALISYDFPGNVRELENILERAIAFANDDCIEVADLALRGGRKLAEPTYSDTVAVEVLPIFEVTDSFTHPIDLFNAPDLPCSLPDYLESVEREMIRRALVQTKNNRTQAAELLGVSFRQLRYQIQKLKIQELD
jgi:two-component system response regulator PilR (NtrC family)